MDFNKKLTMCIVPRVMTLDIVVFKAYSDIKEGLIYWYLLFVVIFLVSLYDIVLLVKKEDLQAWAKDFFTIDSQEKCINLIILIGSILSFLYVSYKILF